MAKMEAFPDSDDDSELVTKVRSYVFPTSGGPILPALSCATHHSICYIMHIDIVLTKELPRANEYCIDRNKRKPHETSKINF